jgi:adenosylcobinamide kinase/adenosylcobinamide-phosphate guanylyltransferase
MRERIALHRTTRDPGWQTAEEPVDIARVLTEAGRAPVLVDCLTLWLTNLLMGDMHIPTHRATLLDALRARRGPTVLVGNEVGLGIVPENALARRFRDEAGLLHQAIAQAAGHVVFMAAGLPLVMK